MFILKVLRVERRKLYISTNIIRTYLSVNTNVAYTESSLLTRNWNLKYNLQNCVTSCQYSANAIKNDIVHKKTTENGAFLTTNSILNETSGDIGKHSLNYEESIATDEIVSTPQELEQIAKLYSHPKVTLNNIYTTIANELKSSTHKLQPHYKSTAKQKQKVLHSWTCTYNVKWPEDHKFSATGNTKNDCSNKAALQVLVWLNKKKKITKDGTPLIYDKSQFNAITTNTSIPLLLSAKEEEKLKEINTEFKNNLSSKMLKNYENDNTTFAVKPLPESWSEFGEDTINRPRKIKNRNLNSLRAKESVQLPIANHRKEIEELALNNRVVVIKGEPGCGKSTRVPQYILEQWVTENGDDACKIVVTQPRRIAAISLAERVANERMEPVGSVVGYQVRLSSNFNPKTGRILYCTTGILLRRLQADPSLQDCTHIILDEAHERDVNTDLLMNLVRNALKLNPNLKLLIMSATIDTGLFQNYFYNEEDKCPSPAIHIPGFAYPVKVHFLDDLKLDLASTRALSTTDSPFVQCEEVASVIKWIHKAKPEGAILCFLPGWEEISRLKRYLQGARQSRDWMVLALHSRLPDSDQRRIFGRPPPGIRKIILATNIAETSVTIDDVAYVIDCGVHKEERYNVHRGTMSIDNHWISQSSMQQRKGRAGRCRKGESFHLYPEHKYNQMAKYSIPEILRTSLTKIVLDSKVYSNNMNAVEFLGHLPNAPDDKVIKQAVRELTELELLDSSENLTALGRTLSDFQLPPKLSRAMVNSVIFKCVSPMVDIATVYSTTSELFATAMIDKEGVRAVKQSFCSTSDHVAMMKLFETWFQHLLNNESEQADMFCKNLNISFYKIRTLEKLRQIHFEYLYKGLKGVKIADDFSDNEEFVKAVLLSGVGTFLQPRKWDIVKGRLKRTPVLVTRNGQKASLTSDSVNHKSENVAEKFLVYINETRSEIRRTTVVRETSQISALALLLFKNEPLYIHEVNDDKFRENFKDPVFLTLTSSRMNFLCERRQANEIVNCKDALSSGLQYFIYQLTGGAPKDSSVDKSWDQILRSVSDLLANESNISD